jgi:hypothetical protein
MNHTVLLSRDEQFRVHILMTFDNEDSLCYKVSETGYISKSFKKAYENASDFLRKIQGAQPKIRIRKRTKFKNHE